MPNSNPKDNKTFTSTEVGTLVEDLKSSFRAVTEVVAPLPGRLSAVEEKLGKLEVRVGSLEDVVRIAIPSLNSRVSALEAKAV